MSTVGGNDPLKKRSGDANAEPGTLDSNLSATVQAFRLRIQNKRREQATEDDRAKRVAQNREAALLQAMTKIRKSLAEVSRIDLGDDEFSLRVEADDWQGWPRIIVSLASRSNPGAELPKLKILAHDRQASGSIEIVSPGQQPEKFSVVREGDVKQLPFALKKAVRSFLDKIAEVVLNSSGEADEPCIALGDKRDLLEKKAARPDSLVGDDENLFDDSINERELFEKLPELDDDPSLLPDRSRT